MPMPSVNDLQTMYGDWNPQAYLQAQSNADLERQYRESEYGRQQELTKQEQLKSMFEAENNPIKLEQGRLTNQNLGYTGKGLQEDNRVKSVNADIAEQTKQYKLNDAQRKDLLAASENDIAMGEAQARRLMMSLDPNERKQGEQLYEFTKYARDEKQKHKQEMEKETFKETSATGRTRISAEATIEAAKIGAQSRLDVAGLRKNAQAKADDIKTQVLSGKLSYEKAAAMLNGAAAFEPDPELQRTYANLAQQYEQAALNLRNAGSAGKVDVGAVAGVPTRENQTVLGKQTPSAEFNIPAGAIQKLKSNPALREAFDAKYGQGASTKILGK